MTVWIPSHSWSRLKGIHLPQKADCRFPTSHNKFRLDKILSFVWHASPRHALLNAALAFLQGSVPLATVIVLKSIVDYITMSLPGTSALPAGPLIWMLAIAIAIGIVGSLANALGGYSATIQSHLVADHMQGMVQRKSIELGLSYYENAQFFDNLHRAQQEAPSRPLRIVQGLLSLCRNGVTLCGALLVLLTCHWVIMVAVLMTSLPTVVFRLKQADKLFELERGRTHAERLSRYLNQVLTTGEHAKELRSFGFGPFIAQRYTELRARLREGLARISAQGYARQFLSESVATTAAYGSLAYVAMQALAGKLSLGELVMYFGAFQVAVGSLRPTLSSISELYENNLFLSSLFGFLALPKDLQEPTHPLDIPSPWKDGLRAEGVAFRYPGTNEDVLKKIDIEIRPGEIVAIVGHNGSGKTTLTKLLSRLYDPSVGRICIDGIDIRNFSINEFRKQISVIYQDFGRYHLSARENIMLGSPELDADDPSIALAAKRANIHSELESLANGYDTIMSRTLADGSEFSGGQWQKLALARAFLRDAQLIILDEPTSSLDAAAEFSFFEQFREMVAGRSALIISHRFSTVRLAKRVYVLDQGVVIEHGTHEELMATGGVYASLYQKQASYYADTNRKPFPSI